MRIEHSIDIAAPVDRVWAVTMDVESWPEHTPSMTSVKRLDDAPLAIGSTARIKQPAQPTRIWTVTAFEPKARFAWTTKALGMRMTGGHQLASIEGGTRNTLTVDIEGALAPLLGLVMRGPIRKAITAENEGFKAAAERRVATS